MLSIVGSGRRLLETSLKPCGNQVGVQLNLAFSPTGTESNGGKFAFAELKAPGKTLRSLQALRKRQLESLGFRVFVIDGTEQIGGVLDAICTP